MESTVPAGWYRDPDGNECERYWDGNNWSLKTRPLITSVSHVPRLLVLLLTAVCKIPIAFRYCPRSRTPDSITLSLSVRAASH